MSGLGEPLLEHLAALIPSSDAGRIEGILRNTPVSETRSMLLEIALPPAAPACDLSLLLQNRTRPMLNSPPRNLDVDRIIENASTEPVWWEYDTSNPQAPVAPFLWTRDIGESVMAALESVPSGVNAAQRLFDLTEPVVQTSASLVGIFAEREPPAVSRVFGIATEDVPGAIEALRPFVTHVVDCESQIARHLLATCKAARISVSMTVSGFSTASIEVFASASTRPQPKAWNRVLDAPPVWGELTEVMANLLATQRMHVFSSLVPAIMYHGVSHLKLTATGHVKVYLTLHPFVHTEQRLTARHTALRVSTSSE